MILKLNEIKRLRGTTYRKSNASGIFKHGFEEQLYQDMVRASCNKLVTSLVDPLLFPPDPLTPALPFGCARWVLTLSPPSLT